MYSGVLLPVYLFSVLHTDYLPLYCDCDKGQCVGEGVEAHTGEQERERKGEGGLCKLRGVAFEPVTGFCLLISAIS